MSRDARIYLDDILESARKAIRYMGSMTFEEFEQNDLVYDGVLRNLATERAMKSAALLVTWP